MAGKTFEMVEGYDAEYNKMLFEEIDRLITAKKHNGITFKEDNMMHQLADHLGIELVILPPK
jgi:hypothetical protein